MNNRKIKFGLTSAVITCIVIVCVLVLNAVVAVISDKHPLTIDLTKDKVYKFSEQTNEVMKNLDDTVKAYALIAEETQGEYVEYIKEYLDKYSSLSDNFKVEYIDPYENPAFMQEYNDGENQASNGSVIIECGDEFKVITFEQIYQQNTYSGAIQIDMEKKVTNAIMAVTGQFVASNIYFTTGHSEYEATNFKSFLTEEGYKCESVNIATAGIPDDISVLISMAPREDFTEEEIEIIDSFMDNGGKYIFVSTPGMKSAERRDLYLKEWGIGLNYDYVIENDKNSSLGTGASIPIPVPKLIEHSITKKIINSDSIIVLPDSTSASLVNTTNQSVVNPLLQTTDASYGKINLSSASIEKEDGDITGPLTVAAISEENQTKNAALVYIGSLGSLETPGVLKEGAYLNGDFVLNVMGYLCGSVADSGIRAKQISAETMTMTQNQVIIYAIVLQYILPLIILICGLIVWIRRRHK